MPRKIGAFFVFDQRSKLSLREHLFLDFSRVGVLTVKAEAVDLATAHRVEDAVLNALIRLLELGEQVLHIFALGGVILGAGGDHDRHRSSAGEVLHVLLGSVEQGTDKRELSVR